MQDVDVWFVKICMACLNDVLDSFFFVFCMVLHLHGGMALDVLFRRRCWLV